MKITLGNVIGKTVKYTIIGTSKLSNIVGKTTAKVVSNEETKEKILKITDKVSSKIQTCSEPIAEFCEQGVDTTILASGKITGKVSKKVAQMCNASEENIEKAEEIGKKAVGEGIGLASSALLITTASAEGTVGASVITSGLAALGGGAVIAGGAGMVAGLVVAYTVTKTIARAVNNTEEENKDEKTKKED